MAFFGYRGRTVGRLMSFLYRYTYNSDHWQFGANDIISDGKVIGTFSWVAGTDIPEFHMNESYKWIETEHALKRDEIAAYVNNHLKIENPGADHPSGWDIAFGVANQTLPIPHYYKKDDFKYMAPEWSEEFFRLAQHTTYADGYTVEEYNRVKPIVDEKFYGYLKDIEVTYV